MVLLQNKRIQCNTIKNGKEFLQQRKFRGKNEASGFVYYLFDDSRNPFTVSCSEVIPSF